MTGDKATYYELPEYAQELQDLIEHKNMNFNVGEAFKALYRLEDKADATYNLSKVLFFVACEIRRRKRDAGESVLDTDEIHNLVERLL